MTTTSETTFIGIILLSASILCMSSFAKSRRSITTNIINKEYNDILTILFKQQTNVTSSSRHITNNLSKSFVENERFQIRKSFFQNLYNSSFYNSNNKRVKIIHIAGTKGKGSTTEFIASALRHEKYKVGVFTSPHLHTARERIKVGNTIIPKDTFVRISKEIIELMKDYDWKVFFDYFLAISIRYFAEQNVDYIILEAGLGGRYDSTNFIDTPDVSVITSISFDHQAVLGDTIEEIAWQKAGIIKPNCPIFTPDTQNDSVLQVFREYSLQVNATLYEVPISYETGINKKNDVIIKPTITKYLSQDKLKYSVQIQNACLALSTLNHLRINPVGMKDFFWPCRMEEFKMDGVKFVLDGCHNGDSVRHFLLGLQKAYPDHAIIVLFGAGKEKCVNDMLTMLINMVDSIVLTQSKHFKSCPEIELCSMLSDTNKLIDHIKPAEYTESGTVNNRMEWILNESKKKNGAFHTIANSCNCNNYVIAVCGSLFVTSEAREWIYNRNHKFFSPYDWVRECDTF